MKKKELNKLKKMFFKCESISDKRKVCQIFSDLGKCGYNFKILSDEEVECAYFQLKEMLICLK